MTVKLSKREYMILVDLKRTRNPKLTVRNLGLKDRGAVDQAKHRLNKKYDNAIDFAKKVKSTFPMFIKSPRKHVKVFPDLDEDREIPFVLVPPKIWHKGRYDDDKINWKASMRNLYYYILTHLSQAYVNQFSKMTAFLPHMLTGNEILLKDRIHKMPLSLPETIGTVD